MLYLKESNGIDSIYTIVDENEELCILKKKADRRCILFKKKWVIVNDQDELFSYCEEITLAVKNCLYYYKKNKKLNIKIIDPYILKLAKKSIFLFSHKKTPFIYGIKYN